MLDNPSRSSHARELKAPGTITLKRLHFYALLLLVALQFGIIAGYGASAFLNKKDSSQSSLSSLSSLAGSNSQQVGPFAPPTADDDPSIGPASAPVTIIEFSDFQCPFCKMFYDQQTLDQILRAYPDQIRFVYRDFPVSSLHPEAQAAAEAAQCANEQGKFWQYHDALFQNQDKLSSAFYFDLGDQLGLDHQAFVNCLRQGRYTSEVAKDFGDGVNAGVTGTPTFFINGHMLEGAHPFDDFKQLIEAELAGLK